MLVTQSILRKYIVLPSLIIAKNVGRMLFKDLSTESKITQFGLVIAEKSKSEVG